MTRHSEDLWQKRRDAALAKSHGFFCTSCNSPHTFAIDSRQTPEGLIRRRRACATCDARFTTIEIAIEHYASPEFQSYVPALRTALFSMKETFDTLTTALKIPRDKFGKQ